MTKIPYIIFHTLQSILNNGAGKRNDVDFLLYLHRYTHRINVYTRQIFLDAYVEVMPVRAHDLSTK